VNFPFIIISFTLALIVLPSREHVKVELHRIDFYGIVLFLIAIVGMILFLLSLENDINWNALGMFVGGFIWFYWYESKKKEPFIDVKGLIKNRHVSYVEF